MLKRTIAKFFVFVIAALFAASCGYVHSTEKRRAELDNAQGPYDAPIAKGRIESEDIKESSGLAVSKCQPDVLWTHNDSGDDAFIFAMTSQGKHLGTWSVAGADNRDWEDISTFKDASGKCFVYIGEIGNNEGKRDRTIVYRIAEPTVGTERTNRRSPAETEPAEALEVKYPATRPNAETLLVHPVSGDIYIVTKLVDGPASIYRLRPQFGTTVPAEKIAEISVPSIPNGLLTGGDISPDGQRVVICDYVAAYEWTLPAGAANFDAVWKQKPVKFDIGDRKNGEAVAFSADGGALYSTSEGKNAPIFEIRRKE